MRPPSPGATARYDIVPDASHSAHALGNTGVHVVGTPFLISFLEMASHLAILPFCDEGESTVGTRVDIEHLAPAFPGILVRAEAKVLSVEGRRVRFAVDAHQNGTLVMAGHHERAIVDLGKFLAKHPGPAAT